MKKILALALVLVLALGMMVPAMAATKAKITETILNTNDIDNIGDINPGFDQELEFPFANFVMNTEARDAIARANSISALNSVMLKIAETAEPRYRSRSGGQIFSDIYVDRIESPSVGTVSLADINTAGALLYSDWGVGIVGIGGDPYSSESELRAALKTAGATSNVVTRAVAAYNAVVLERLRADALAGLASNWSFIVILETVDPWASVNDVDFEVDVYLLIDGKRTDTVYYWTLYGNFSNDVTTVYADTYDADSYLGQVIEADEYVSKIAICGNYEYDINANVKMAKDKKIYFYVTTEADLADEGVFDKYPAIEVAFKVLQVGLNSYTGNFISLDGVDSTYYVYGKDANGALKYLGRGGELLPLSSKYYISTAKLDISDNSSIDEDLPTDPVPEDNFNPSTGI